MANDNSKLWIAVGIFVGAFALLRAPNKDVVESPQDADKSDVNALARMLESETRNQHAREIIGYIVVQRAKRLGISIYEMLTRGKGWGKQDRRDIGQGIMYASTSKVASERTKELARDIIAGNFAIPQIVKDNPGAWYEKYKGIKEEDLISRQKSWDEGIYAKIAGTNWYLYSKKQPKIGRLEDVPHVV